MEINHGLKLVINFRTVRWKRIILSFVICGGKVDGVSTSAYEAPAAAASLHSCIVSDVDCAPVPAITTTDWKLLSSRVCRVVVIASDRSS